jgi:hypothetical protein
LQYFLIINETTEGENPENLWREKEGMRRSNLF